MCHYERNILHYQTFLILLILLLLKAHHFFGGDLILGIVETFNPVICRKTGEFNWNKVYG